MAFYCFVHHVCFRRRAEHLVNRQVKRTYAVGLFKGKAVVACRFAYHVHRSTFAFGNLLHVFDGFLFNQQSHAFLRFVGDDFLCRQCFVADRQFVHVDQTAAVFHQLRQAVYVSSRAVVVDRNNRILVFFT